MPSRNNHYRLGYVTGEYMTEINRLMKLAADTDEHFVYMQRVTRIANLCLSVWELTMNDQDEFSTSLEEARRTIKDEIDKAKIHKDRDTLEWYRQHYQEEGGRLTGLVLPQDAFAK